ncbi:MAG: hypothetical protein ABJD24_02675 [Acidimicrobiales bacterium]
MRPAFQLADVADELIAVGVDRVVLVQAADNVADTENMLRAANHSGGHRRIGSPSGAERGKSAGPAVA